MIQALNLTKRYGEKVALQDVSFHVGPGVVCGLLGPNGAGKTSAIKILLGLLRPTSGSAALLGRPPAVGAARNVGFSLDAGGGLDPGLRVADQLKIVAGQAGVPKAAVDSLLTDPALRELGRQRIGTLSTGQRQGVALAAAGIAHPRVLILDEPTAGLDAEAIHRLRDDLRSFASAGGAVLVSSHHLLELERSVDHVVILNRTVRFAGALPELLGGGYDDLEQAYFALVTDGAGRASSRPLAEVAS